MASNNRTRRIAEEIRKIVSTMLINGIKDPRINSLVSVTDVEVTNDLSYAYVYVSILGGDEESTLLGLKSAVNYIRRGSVKSSRLSEPELLLWLLPGVAPTRLGWKIGRASCRERV